MLQRNAAHWSVRCVRWSVLRRGSLAFSARTRIFSLDEGSGEITRMGNYRFERDSDDDASPGELVSLEDDVERALGEIDWVERFTVLADQSDETLVSVDITFDEDWPDLSASSPGLVAGVFQRHHLRLLPRPQGTGLQGSAADPLSTDASVDILDEDAEGLDLFQFED